MRPTCADAFSCYASSKIGSGCQSIYNICMLNYCKLTFEFFKNYIFEKRRQFLNRVISATDGGVQKHYRVFRTKNSKFKNWQGRQFLNRR